MTPPAVAVARRLADYTVLAHDPGVAEASATFWEDSRMTFQRVDAATVELLAAGSPARRSYCRLRGDPQSLEAYASAWRDLRAVLDGDASACRQMADVVGRADQEIWIDYHLGSAYRGAPADTVSIQQLLRGRQPGWWTRSASAAVHVVIPFRDRTGEARIRNLVACLLALRDQVPEAGAAATVTVVEADEQPRWRRVIEPLADRYRFLPHAGEFNKSWVVNVGVVQSPVTAGLICVLDADVIVDRHFLLRNRRRLNAVTRGAHLPYRWMYCLDGASTDTAIRTRCQQGRPDVPLDELRAYALREPPGACLWVTAEVFHGIGGFDERFVGWGGEDNDVVARLAAAGTFRRYDDPLLHLDHERPTMRRDGRPLNPPEQPEPWSAASGYGSLASPPASRSSPAGFSRSGRRAQETPC